MSKWKLILAIFFVCFSSIFISLVLFIQSKFFWFYVGETDPQHWHFSSTTMKNIQANMEKVRTLLTSHSIIPKSNYHIHIIIRKSRNRGCFSTLQMPSTVDLRGLSTTYLWVSKNTSVPSYPLNCTIWSSYYCNWMIVNILETGSKTWCFSMLYIS